MAAAVLLLAIALAVVLVTRGDAAAPDGTARLVPAGALLYVHVSTSESRSQDAGLSELAGRFSALRLAFARLGMALTPAAGALDLERDIRPWLGDEAAVALLDAGDGRTEPLLLAAVRDRDRAEALLDRLGARPAGAHRGVALRRLPPASTAAFAGDHLAVGPAAAVRGAIDREAGAGTPALAGARVFRRAAEQRVAAASVDVYAGAAGLRRLGLAGFFADPRLEGVSAQVSAEEAGLRVDARLLRAPGGPPRAAFTPSLAERVPGDAAAFLALPGVDALAQAFSSAGGAALLEGLREALPQAAGVELEDVLAPLGDEAALTVTEGEAAPVFTLTARTRDAAATRAALARLQGPLSERLAGGAPFEQRGDRFSLRVTPELEPSYAIVDGAVVMSTAGSGLGQLAPARSPVTSEEALDWLEVEDDARVQALGFVDPRKLLALGERTGLDAFGAPAVRDDLSQIRAAGLVVEEDADNPSDTTAEMFLEIP